jgi:hypothetical protein
MTMPKRIRKVNPAWLNDWRAAHGQGDTKQFTASYVSPVTYIENEVDND